MEFLNDKGDFLDSIIHGNLLFIKFIKRIIIHIIKKATNKIIPILVWKVML